MNEVLLSLIENEPSRQSFYDLRDKFELHGSVLDSFRLEIVTSNAYIEMLENLPYSWFEVEFATISMKLCNHCAEISL